MCTSPLLIINKTKKFVDLHHKLFLNVPCGKCDSCRESYINDWQVRCYSEMENYRKLGGKTLFFTLTYKPSCRPFYTDHSVDLDGNPFYFSFPCFSSYDIHTFVRSFVRFCERNFFPSNVLPFKYFCACEYGKDPNGQRCPHYHLLFHIPPCSCTDTQLVNLARRLWSVSLPKNHPLRNKTIYHYDLNGNVICDKSGKPKLYKKVRQSLGFVLVSDKGLVVESSFACSYCAKYCAKDINFFDHPSLNLYLNKNNPNYKIHKEKIKNYLPKHWQSVGYGSSLLEILGLDFCNTMLNGFHLPNQPLKTFSLPRYIVDKNLYKISSDGRRFYSDLGKDYMSGIFDIRLKKFESSVNQTFTNLRLKQLTESQRLNIPLPKGCNFDRFNFDYVSFFKNLIGSRLKLLSLYYLYWQNRTSLQPDLFIELDKLDYKRLYSLTKSFYIKDINLNPSDIPLYDSDSSVVSGTDEFDNLKCLRFNNCKIFKDFDYLISVITYINSCIQSNNLSAILYKRKFKDDSKYLLKYRKNYG